ncbi:MmgE/PrpD family protein [Halorarius halobius]|uniref:MmgE/PrpD family protein n=1 Tax=Halorarius halobius TaxID=2962671 RepID=UPI0020CEB227|nr:MmgE/PrpD family protein [Halorarius halobius]
MVRLPFVGGDDEEPPFLERAAAWATDLGYRDVPPAVRRAARAQVHSTVGAAVWSLDLPVADEIAAAVERDHGDGPVSFLGGPDSTLRGACWGHAALSMALDFDDTVLGGHTGHSSVFVPLAAAEATGASGRRALTAVVAANEVAARVASAAAVGPFRGQQTAYVHAVAAAVARAVIEGDDADTLADALGVALGQPPWPLDAAFLGSDAKLTSAADPLLVGLTAVTRAREGARGATDLLEAEGGFLEAFASKPLPEFLTGLGERWHTRALTVKPVPGCAYVTAPVEAALELRRELPDREVTIGRVTVEGSLFCTEVNDRATPHVRGPDSTLAALSFSVPYNVASALLRGEHTARQFTPAALGESRVWKLADNVAVEHDPQFTMAALDSEVPLGAMLRRVGPGVIPYSMSAVGPATTLRHLPTLARFVRKRPLPDDLSTADKRMGARVTVELDGGETLSATVDHPTGFAGHTLPEVRAVARNKLRAALEARGASDPEARRAADELDAMYEAETVALGEWL